MDVPLLQDLFSEYKFLVYTCPGGVIGWEFLLLLLFCDLLRKLLAGAPAPSSCLLHSSNSSLLSSGGCQGLEGGDC